MAMGFCPPGVRDERGEKRIAGLSTKLVKGRNPAFL